MNCPRCRAVNPDRADWCGQCLMRFGAPIPAPPPGTAAPEPGGGVLAGGDGATAAPAHPPDLGRTIAVQLVPAAAAGIRKVGEHLEWTCRACEAVNPIDEVLCRRCGTSMLELFRPSATRRVPRDRRVALALSLLPGLGHWYAGAAGQGLARLALFLWWLAVAAAVRSRPEAAFLLVKGCFAGAALALWVLSALDAERLARRARPLLGARALAVAAGVLCLVLVVGLLAAAALLRGHP
jgi:ribosomal protein L40E